VESLIQVVCPVCGDVLYHTDEEEAETSVVCDECCGRVVEVECLTEYSI